MRGQDAQGGARILHCGLSFACSRHARLRSAPRLALVPLRVEMFDAYKLAPWSIRCVCALASCRIALIKLARCFNVWDADRYCSCVFPLTGLGQGIISFVDVVDTVVS